jgi:hypothetical protein
MDKLKSGKIQIISNQGRSVVIGKKAPPFFSFFRFSSSAPLNAAFAASKVSLKEPLLKGVHLSKTSGRLAAIEKWVDLEEKIVHDYKNRKTPSAKPIPPLSISSTVSYASTMPVLKKSAPGSGSALRWNTVLWVSGWALAGLFAFFYLRELPLRQDTSSRIAGILAEKSRLEQSYAKIKIVSDEQRGKLQRLGRQVQRMSGELRFSREKAARVDLLEKTYRQELMRITTDYEIQLDTLRESLRSRDEIVTALRTQMQAIEQMIDQGSLSAVSGIASRAAQHESSGSNAPAFPRGDDLSQGKVTQVNTSQGFFVVNTGSESGTRSGVEVKVYREGALIGVGVTDRVYPTMSSVTMRDRRALYDVREGDLVLF